MRSNCYIWCAYKRIRYGGQIKAVRSLRWKGYHTIWIDPQGQAWEYTIPRLKNKPWWYVPILYNGVVRRIKTSIDKQTKE